MFNLAVSRFYKGQYDKCIKLCDNILKNNPKDLSTQLLKIHSIRKMNYIDHLEIDEQTLGDLILDDHTISSIPRPGTSLKVPTAGGGRPMTGVVRPGTRSGNSSGDVIKRAGSRAGTARATTSGGRYIRLATASLQSLNTNSDLDVNDINTKTIVLKKSLSKAVSDYLFYVSMNFKVLLELCSEATKASEFRDWFWKFILGRTYLKVGLLSEAERQLISAFKDSGPFPYVPLTLARVYLRMDQPARAIESLNKAKDRCIGECNLEVHMARIEEMLMNYDASIALYREVLLKDNCNFEALACIGSNYFYNDMPEIALTFYKRLLELGITTPEVWNNIGLCAFMSNQYDICLSCFEHGLTEANDEESSDIWYNISHVAIYVGDLNLAYQALKLSVSFNPMNTEALTNLSILELRKGRPERARTELERACKNSTTYEPLYNLALLKMSQGAVEEARRLASKASEISGGCFESKELENKLKQEIME